MDFANAAMLAFAVFVVVEFAKKLIPGVAADSRIIIAITLLAGIGATFLVGETVWAHQQVISGKALDELDGWSKLVTGLFLAAGAVGIHKIVDVAETVSGKGE